jgi:DNA-binding GntR family transcriptional regulator
MRRISAPVRRMTSLATQSFLDQDLAPRGRRLAGDAYNRVKAMVLEGDLSPGERLSVVDLSRAFGCSRVPIMEALKRLEGEGLVQIEPQIGCRVIVPEPGGVGDFFEVFAVTEALVARLAAERRSDAQADEFRRVCSEIEAKLKSAGGPADHDATYRHVNLLFHTQIHLLARAPEPSRISARLWDRSDFYIRVAFGSLYFSRRVRRAHGAVRDAILQGRAIDAETAMREHLQAVGTAVADELRKQTVNVADGS